MSESHTHTHTKNVDKIARMRTAACSTFIIELGCGHKGGVWAIGGEVG